MLLNSSKSAFPHGAGTASGLTKHEFLTAIFIAAKIAQKGFVSINDRAEAKYLADEVLNNDFVQT